MHSHIHRIAEGPKAILIAVQKKKEKKKDFNYWL